ncbi:hypothetical protein, partial [Pseudomonas viridiflava]
MTLSRYFFSGTPHLSVNTSNIASSLHLSGFYLFELVKCRPIFTDEDCPMATNRSRRLRKKL